MKINWGTSIVIAIAAFICFIMYMVITMVTDKRYNHDLVTEDYYQKELLFQGKINAANNAKGLSSPIRVKKVTSGLKIIFPKDLDPKGIKGKVFLYRPSNKKLDFEMPISITDTYLLVPEKHLLGGRWDIDVSFTYKDKEYLHSQKIKY